MSTPPSGPYYPPAPPSGPYYPPGAPSQPLYPGGPQMGSYYGGPPVAVAAPPATPKRSLGRLWITLGVIAALLAVLGGAAIYVLAQYGAPAAAASQFCTDLKGQSYGGAYQLLSSKLTAQYSQSQFAQAMTTLDTAEGKVDACGQASGGNAYNYSLGGSTATVMAVITRDKNGSLQGAVHLDNESGGWKITALDTSLVGVNLGALAVAATFCQDMQAQNYSSAYQLLSSNARGSNTASSFQTAAQLQDQVDGTVTACSLVGLGPTNNDSTATLEASITRAKLGQRQGTLTLTYQNGSWLVDSLDQKLSGTDLSALVVGLRFCVDINTHNYKDAYSISGLYVQSLGNPSESQFAQNFNGTPVTFQGQTVSLKWNTCKVDPTTYKVSGTTAQVSADVNVTVSIGGQTQSGALIFPLQFAQVNGAWELSNLGTPTNG